MSSFPPPTIPPPDSSLAADDDREAADEAAPRDVKNGTVAVIPRSRPTRACTVRTAARLQSAAAAEATRVVEKRRKETRERKRKDRRRDEYGDRGFREEIEDYLVEEDGEDEECGSGVERIKEVMELVGPPAVGQELRWSLRSMWELASVLNFLHVFRPLLNIAEEFETALIIPNDTLGDIHMTLLKSIPPITRMALTHDTWITVLARKLRDWWHWKEIYLLFQPKGQRLVFTGILMLVFVLSY